MPSKTKIKPFVSEGALFSHPLAHLYSRGEANGVLIDVWVLFRYQVWNFNN